MTGRYPRRGDLWLVEIDRIRPAVVMHRDFAGRHLSALLVAPLTSTIRDIPTAVRLGPQDGVDRECIAALDNLSLVQRTDFVRHLGEMSPARMEQLCQALATAVACS